MSTAVTAFAREVEEHAARWIPGPSSGKRPLDEWDFWGRVEHFGSADCWLWVGKKNENGYGRLTFQARGWQAHRLAYELIVGPIPAGLTLDHLCRTRDCVNPAHLEPVTHQENMLRARKTHCNKGHLYTPENTYIIPANQTRTCRICKKQRDKEAGEARRAARRAA